MMFAKMIVTMVTAFKAPKTLATFKTMTVLLMLWTVCLGAELHAEPRAAQQRIILTTDYGDLVLALYPDVAPAHVQQILKLVKLGAYDSTHFFRVIPGFIVQLTDVNNRLQPLTGAQAAAIAPIKAEFSDSLKHRKGTLSMARWDDPDSATSSFSILLGDAPHLDGQYTIFGELESGGSVVNRILDAPRENDTPKQTIAVRKAYVITNLAQYYSRRPFDPIDQIGTPVPMEQKLSFAEHSDSVGVLNYIAALALGIVLTGLLGYFLYDKLSKSWMLSLLMVNVLISGFILFIVLTPVGRGNSWVAAGLFIAMFAMFRLMSTFENKKG
jgi:cyclophilin family peptidyl-prolyl cis-trans isomerase